MTRPRTVGIATLAVVSALAIPARAQQLLLGGGVAASSGVEGGDAGAGETQFRRARTRLSLQLDGRIDEDPREGLGVVVYADVEPHAGVGAELRYLRWLGPRTVAFVGVTSVIAPRTLFGGELGAQLRFPVGKQGPVLFVEPSFAALPLGTDLPGDRPVIWALLGVGIHVDL